MCCSPLPFSDAFALGDALCQRLINLSTRFVLSFGRKHRCQQARSAAVRAEMGPDDVKRRPLIARTGKRAQTKLLSIGPSYGGSPTRGSPSSRYWILSIPVLYPVAQIMISACTAIERLVSTLRVGVGFLSISRLPDRLGQTCSTSTPNHWPFGLPETISFMGDPRIGLTFSSSAFRCNVSNVPYLIVVQSSGSGQHACQQHAHAQQEKHEQHRAVEARQRIASQQGVSSKWHSELERVALPCTHR